MGDNFPQKMQSLILHATLSHPHFILMGTDMMEVDENSIEKNTSFILTCKNKYQLQRYYKKLFPNSKQSIPLKMNFWGAYYINITDKFANRWTLSYFGK